MNTRIAIGILGLTAMFAVSASAADSVKIWPESGGIAALNAGDHKFANTIIQVEVPVNMAVVCYRDSQLVAVFSYANSDVKSKVKVDVVKVVESFPSKEAVEKLNVDSKWVGMWTLPDGAKVKDDQLTIKNGKMTSEGVTYTLNGVNYRGGKKDRPVAVGIPDSGDGHEIIFEWITPTVLRADAWEIGKKAGAVKNNPAKFLGVFSLHTGGDAAPGATAKTQGAKAKAGLTNPSFEEPLGQKGSFAFVNAMPGWKTTDRAFEIWSTGFQGFKAHHGDQFVELNANIDGTLYQDSTGIEAGAVLEFTFAHRGRNGKDTMKLTITDLGKDNALGGVDDKVLFTKEYSTGKDAWAVYNSTKEKQIVALGNTVRFGYTAVYGTGGKGPNKTEGNFLDAADFGVGVVSAPPKPVLAKMVTAGHSQTTKDDAGEHILTKDLESQSGAVWSASKISLDENFKISAEIFLGSKEDGADGLALVFQAKDNNIVATGSGMGYQGVSPSIAIEFDTYENRDDNNDPVKDHVGLQTNGNPVHRASDYVEVGNLEDGKYHPITFEWNASKMTLNLTLDGKQIFKDKQLPPNDLVGRQVFFGFTAATGLYSNLHKVRSISHVVIK